jgi:hypothetical protein
MNISAVFKSLCLPSKVYFVLAVIGILLSIFLPAVFGGASFLGQAIHIVYVVFWTWVLNLICKAGYKWLSWVLVLAPFVVAFFVVALVLNSDQAQTPIVVLSQ